MFHKILLASDGSTHALNAAEKTIHLIDDKQSAFVEIVYVVDENTSKSDVFNHHLDSHGITAHRKEILATTEKKIKDANIPYKITILHGDPGTCIVDFSNKNNFDIVVMGNTTRSCIKEIVHESVSHKVAKAVKCAILLVR